MSQGCHHPWKRSEVKQVRAGGSGESRPVISSDSLLMLFWPQRWRYSPGILAPSPLRKQATTYPTVVGTPRLHPMGLGEDRAVPAPSALPGSQKEFEDLLAPYRLNEGQRDPEAVEALKKEAPWKVSDEDLQIYKKKVRIRGAGTPGIYPSSSGQCNVLAAGLAAVTAPSEPPLLHCTASFPSMARAGN